MFHKLCRIAQSSRAHKTEAISVMGHARSAAVSSMYCQVLDSLGFQCRNNINSKTYLCAFDGQAT